MIKLGSEILHSIFRGSDDHVGLLAISLSIKRNTMNHDCKRLDCGVEWGLGAQIVLTVLCQQERVLMAAHAMHMAMVGGMCGQG